MSEKTVGRNTACPCGSGKKFKRCCGHSEIQSVVIDPDTWVRQGYAAQRQGNQIRAAQLYRQALKFNPKHRHGNYLLGLILEQQGDLAAALDLLSEAARFGLDDPAFLFKYARMLAESGELQSAFDRLNQAIKLKRDFLEARKFLANLQFVTGQYAQAQVSYNACLELSPDDWVLHFNLAHCLFYLGRYDEVVACFDRARALSPADAEIPAAMAIVHENHNALDLSQACLDVALMLDKHNASALVTQARLWRRAKQYEQAKVCLAKVEIGRANALSQISYWNELGELNDKLGLYIQAFKDFKRSKAALGHYRKFRYVPDYIYQPLERSEAYFCEHRRALPIRYSEPLMGQPLPIFIVGFHRSGTSLIEQALDSHPDIAGAGELLLIMQLQYRLEQRLGKPFPDCLDRLTRTKDADAFLSSLRLDYIEGAKANCSDWQGQSYIVDKHPFNSRYLPMIALLFPQAPVIQILRHPLDVTLSCFFSNFYDPNEWSFEMDDIARLYHRTCQHIDNILPSLPLRDYQLRYEDLVESPEIKLRELLDFIGLNWDERCLLTHENKRVVRTASYSQVTEPIHTGSRYRYRNYISQIDTGVIDELAPLILQQGYPLDTVPELLQQELDHV